MNRPLFFFGCLLLIGLVATTTVGLVQTKAFAITTINCTLSEQSCPTEVTDQLNAELMGKSLFITDFDQELSDKPFKIVKYYKQLPGQLQLTVESDATILAANPTAAAATTPEQVRSDVTQVLTEAGVAFQQLEVKPEANLVVVQLNPERALLRYDAAKADSQKVVLIKKHLRLAEIDTAIVEIDARYQMPVLRTAHTNI